MTRSNYERTHPVISIRVSQEIHNDLQERRQDGQSYGDILRIGLGKEQAYNEPLIKKIEELELEALELEELVDKRTVTYPCSRCGKPIQVESEQEKKVCRQALRGRFRHSTCRE